MTSKELSTIFSIVLTPCQLLGYWAPLTQNGSETTKSWAVHTLTSHQVSGLRCLCARAADVLLLCLLMTSLLFSSFNHCLFNLL